MKINTNQLVAIISEIDGKGATFAELTTETVVKMNKGRGENTNPYYGKVTKRSRLTATLNFNYENAVNRKLEKNGEEADFVAGPRAWGYKNDELNGTLVYGSGEPKLQVMVNNVFEIDYLLDGEKIEKTTIEQYLPKHKEDFVPIRAYNVSSIKKIKLNKETYEIDE